MVNKCVMSITLNLLATAADSAPYVTMAAGSDPEAVEDPVATGDVKCQSQPSNHTPANLHHSHYIGLPYQDHNYGAPPPPTPPASPPPKLRPVSPTNKLNGFLDDNLNISTLSTSPNCADDSVTRCICNFEHDDGYMISCDKCLTWQHVECMGLERNNIPDCYFCERCQPRPVDVQKAIALQTKKREQISNDSSSSDSEESNAVNPTTYTAISNSPTRLTLTTHHKNKKSKKKKRKREHSERSHKKKKKKHDKKSRSRSLSSELNFFDEDTQAAWHQSENNEEYEEVSRNEYTAELQQFVVTHKPDIGATIPNNRLRANITAVATVNNGRKGLVAKERITDRQTILEYHGKVMFKKQLLAQNTFFRGAFYRYILNYSHFANVDICIDSRVSGNKARYVRRSCSPNSQVLHTTEGELIRLFLVSSQEISKDSEVTIAFDFNYKECPFPVECACGKKNCPIRKYQKHRHDSDGKRKNQKNNHIKKDDSNSCGTQSAPVSGRRRTVSPLRVSLSNQLQNSVIEDITPTKMTEEETQADVDVETEENQPESSRKLTREERKMEAIMKAFEKMERTQKRRQQALDRLAVAKDTESSQAKTKTLEEESTDSNLILQVDQPTDDIAKSNLPQQTVETQSINLVAKLPAPKRRKKRYNSTPRRRTRNNSAASIISTEIKPLEQSFSSFSAAPVASTPPLFPSISSPARTHGVTTVHNNNNDRLLPLISPVTCNSKHFKFPKTKKLFLNEWLNEKAQEACADNPLSISTDLVDMVDSASPNSYAHSHLARSNSLSALAAKSGPEASLGSAKKRWLRLAMNEAGGVGGGDSPVGSGALSPSGIVAGSAISPKNDTITPLKKRWLRISVNDEQSGTVGSAATSASSSPLHPSSETDYVPPSTSAVLNVDIKPDISVADNLLTTVSSSSLTETVSGEPKEEPKEINSQLDVVNEIEGTVQPKCELQEVCQRPHQDCRKNSSIDSGLSVTTPMEISENLNYFNSDSVYSIDQNKVVSSSENKVVNVPIDGKPSTTQLESAVNNELLTEKKPLTEALHMHSKYDQNRPNEPITLETSDLSEGRTVAKVELDKSTSSSHTTMCSIASGDASQTDPLGRSASGLSDLQQSWSSVSEFAQSSNSIKSLNLMEKDHLNSDNIGKTIHGLDFTIASQRARHLSSSSAVSCPNTIRTLNFESAQRIGTESARSSLDDQIGPQSYASPKKRALLLMRDSENLLTQFSAGWRDSLSDATENENKMLTNNLGEKENSGKLLSTTGASLDASTGPRLPSGQSSGLTAGSVPLPVSNPAGSVIVPQTVPSETVHGPQPALHSTGSAPQQNAGQVTPATTGLQTPGMLGLQQTINSGMLAQTSPQPLGSSNTPPLVQAGGLTSTDGVLPTGGQSPVAVPAVKKKVSLCEYRKRKITTKPMQTSSEPSTPVKSITSSLSKSSDSTPVKAPATLPTLPLFDTPPPVEKDMTGKGLRLSTEAEKAISSFTSLLKDTGEVETKRPSAPAESAVSQYKGLSEKMSRIGPNHSLKRARSPEPPPPPPNKKPTLQLHIPPPPPPKTKADPRVAFNSADSTPPFGRHNSYQASPVASAATRNNPVIQMYQQQGQQFHAASSSSPRGHQTSLNFPVKPSHPSPVNSTQPSTYPGYHEQGTPTPKHPGHPPSQQYYGDGYQLYPQQTSNVPPPPAAPQGVNFQQQQRPQLAKPPFPKQAYGHSYSPRRGYYKS
ncbi:uncharacterized protein [Antedon mediterranea]|uniref:uncharacterized protein isoform X2 n=1 Tax=Antedon mediterranea TaxID=105859 RepID=UPI003AF8A5A5